MDFVVVDNFRGAFFGCATLLDMEKERIEGYRIRRALGAGSAGTAWLARDLASGRPVVLRRIPASDVPAPQLFRRDLALARGLDHEHAVRLVDVRQTGREWVLISDFVAAGSMADLLQRRRPLGTGELVTLLIPVAQALAAAHRVGLTHDHLGPGDILLTADGRPIIGDFGLRSVVPESDRTDDFTALTRLAGESAADTAALSPGFFTGGFADIAARLLDLTPPRPIALAFGTTPTPDPRPPDTRPSVLARFDVSSAPVRLPRPRPRPPDPNAPGRPPTPNRLPANSGGLSRSGHPSQAGGAARFKRSSEAARSSQRRRAAGRHRPRAAGPRSLPGASSSDASVTVKRLRVLGIVAVVVSAVGVTIGLSLNASQADQTRRLPTATPTPIGPIPTLPIPTAATTRPTGAGGSPVEIARWRTVLYRLDAARARAFATPDVRLLDAVYERGSAPWRADRSLLATYRSRSTRVESLRITVESVEVVRRNSRGVVLRVTDSFTGGDLITEDGATIRLPAGPRTTRLITLTTDGSQWRIVRIAGL